MKFFTPDLYLRYTASDKPDVDRAEAEWEHAVSEYHAYLSRFSGEMNERVRELAEDICLHDAELLSLQEDAMASSILTPTQTPVVSLSLRVIGRAIHLTYFLWAEIGLSTAPKGWTSSQPRLHWLCDEIDREPGPSSFPRYYHHVLLSDGRALSIPFYEVVVHSFSETDPRPALITRRRA